MGEYQLYLCLGGNIGNKSQIFKKTLLFIGETIGRIEQVSPLIVSPPWGFEAKTAFWNQVVVVATLLSPAEVLQEIRKIEAFFGRMRVSGRYISRRMDIDILFYDQLVLETEELSIPHPLIGRRRFVLAPLALLSPEFRHPGTGKTMAEMLAECEDPSAVQILNPK
jgi:2-amino-4-hydroxy-6-hydroxymethyldihydropteridine diphosphokinase